MAGRTEWVEEASATNTTGTATHAAESERTHVVTMITASYEGNVDGLLTLLDGTTTVLRIQVHDDFQLSLAYPIRLTEGNKAEATLEASGGAGVVGYVSIGGYTL